MGGYPVTVIGSSAFKGKTALECIWLPENITSVDSNAFQNCTALREINISDSLISIGSSAFNGCTALESFDFPLCLETIGTSAFAGCTALINADLSDTVKKIDNNAFQNCTSLVSFTCPKNWTSAGTNIFKGCISLTALSIPEGITSLPANAFYSHSYLETVILPDSVTTLEQNAFYCASSLKHIWIGENVTAINRNALSVCPLLTVHGVAGSYAETYASNNNIPFSSDPIVINHGTISGFVSDANGIGTPGVTISFYDLTEKELAGSCVTDENGNWSWSDALVGHNYSIRAHHSMYDIDHNTQTVSVTSDTAATSPFTAVPAVSANISPAEDFTITVINGTYASVSGYKGEGGMVVIPSEINGYIIQSIADNAFKNQTSVTGIILPDTVESVGNNAFYGCSALSYVGFGSMVKTIGNYAFYQCTALVSVTMNISLTSIGSNAFYSCTALSDVDLPMGLQIINSSAFYGCTALAYIDIPDSVTTIGSSAFSTCTSLTTIGYPEGWTKVSSSSSPFSGCTSLTSVTVDEGVTAIPANAFRSCSLQSITFPESLTSIGNSAFENCTALAEVSFPHSLTSIGAHAFRYCSSLTSVTLPENITSVNIYSFGDCTGLTELILPEGLLSIQSYAFQSCTSLASVDIPDSVTSLSGRAFYNCTTLKTVNLPSSWNSVPCYSHNSTSDDCKSSASARRSPFEGCSSLISVKFDDGVTVVPSYAFSYFTSLKSVELPNSITSIGSSVFYNCSGLKSIALPSGVTSIGTYAFYNCSALSSLTIPDSVTSLGDYVFRGCAGLTSITLPDLITVIPNYAFSDCKELEEIVLPKHLTEIKSYVFSNCLSLESLDIPDTVSTMGGYLFSGCSALKRIDLPSSWTSCSSTYSLLANCTALTYVTVDENITVLPKNAFYSASYLETVILPKNLTAIGQQAFASCTALKHVWIDENVTDIGSNAFRSCSALTIHGIAGSYAETYANTNNIPFSTETITLSYNSVIGSVSDENGIGIPGISVTFYDLTAQELAGTCFTDENGNWSWSDAVIGHTYNIRAYHSMFAIDNDTQTVSVSSDSVTTSPFTAVRTITEEVSPAEDFTISVLNGTYASISGYKGNGGMVVIPSEIDGYIIQSISNDAFKNNTAITGVILPDTVETLGNSAFYYCSNLSYVGFGCNLKTIGSSAFSSCTSLVSVTLNSGLTTLGSSAFGYCSALSDITLPMGLDTINSSAFSSCKALEYIDIPDSVTKLDGNVFANCSSLAEIGYPAGWTQGSSSPFYNCTMLTSITVDDGTTSIPASAFLDMTWLKTVILPDSLTSIGNYAFNNCTSITEIDLPENLTSIGYYAFNNCKKLTEITVPAGVSALNRNVFQNCTSLSSVNLSEGLGAIYAYAFQNCTALVSIDIPDSVTTLGSRAFYQCTSLKEIDFSSSWNRVTDTANNTPESSTPSPFDGCTSLTEITIDEGMTSLPAYAFHGMTGLVSVRLPESVTSIGAYAFFGCTKLKNVRMSDSVTSLGNYCFCNCSSIKTFRSPSALTTIGNYAFNGCTGLMYISLSDSLETIGSDAFQNCSALRMIRIPDGVTTLRSYIFNGCSKLTAVTLPKNLEKIESYAFYNCVMLEQLKIPNSVNSISTSAFKGVPSLTFYCNLYTYAATYAIDNKIPIVDLGETVPIEGASLDRENTFYKVNYDGISAFGYLSMAADYAFVSVDGVSNVSITFNIPSSVKLIEKTIYVDGKLCTNYSYSNSTLTIPGKASGGSIRFCLEPQNYDKVTAYAKISFRDALGTHNEVLGTVYTELPILSITTRGETGTTEAAVNGVTIPGQTVTLSVNGVAQKTVTANKAGDYSAVLDLGSPANGKACTVGAQITYNGETITAEAVTYYRIGSPTITKFLMEHNGQKFDMIGKENIKPVVTFTSGKPFKFTVQFDSAEYVRSVYIVSTRNNIRKTMKAEWNEEADAFIASGFFDPKNVGYIPGVITVEYVNTGDKISFDTEYDFTSEEMKNSVPEKWVDAEVEVKENSEDKVSVQLKEPEKGDTLDFSVENIPIPEDITRENIEDKGYIPVTDDYGNTVYVKYTQLPAENSFDLKYEIIEFAKEETRDSCAEFVVKYVTNETIGDYFGIAIDIQSAIGDSKDAGAEYYQYKYDYENMLNTIRNSNLDEETKKYAIQSLEYAIALNNLALFGRVFGYSVNLVASFSNFNPFVSFLINLGFKAYDMLLDNELKEMHYMMEQMMFDLFGCEFTFRWAIDPSGYVYNIQSGKRIPGVTTTVYWIPLDDDTDTTEYFAEQPPADEYGVKWDASEFSQLNPLITDDNGCYSWDVPEGWWRVSYEKDGYETTWSEWLPVPPEQKDVNIGMTPTFERIRGTVTSYTMSKEIVLALYASDADDTTIASDMMTGTSANAVETMVIIADEKTANGRYSKDYTFKYTEEGEFKLAIWTDGAYSPIIIPVEITEEILTVSQTDLFLLGDINGDGAADTADNEILAHYFAGWQTDMDMITAELADMNRDGRITRADAMLLARTINGWYE